jgi:hypothetical protein
MSQNNFLNKFTSIYTDKSVNGYVRGIAWLSTAAVAYIVGNSIVKAIKVQIANANDIAKLKQLESDLNNLSNKGIKPSYDVTQYNNWADAIEAGLQGCDLTLSATVFGMLSNVGTRVWNVLSQLKNDADYLSLSKAYGQRTIPKSWTCGYSSNVTGGLDATLTRILNHQEVALINTRLGKMGLTSKI